MRRELGRGLAQDQAKKGQRIAIHAAAAAFATPTRVSNSSHGASNAGLPSDASLPERSLPQDWSGEGWSWPGSGSSARALRAWRVDCCGSDSRPIFRRENFLRCRSANRTRGIRPGVRGFITRHEPGITWLVKQAGQSQVNRPNSRS